MSSQSNQSLELNEADAGSSGFTHDIAPTRFVEADGIRFAYRRFGNPVGTPIVLFQHFVGNLDNYDPAITDALAMGREVILTDNAGIGHSAGAAPESVVDRPELVRRLVLVGTGPRGGEDMSQLAPDVAPLFETPYDPQDLMWLPIFFSPSEESQAASRRFLERIRRRTEDRDVPVSEAAVAAHAAAAGEWGSG